MNTEERLERLERELAGAKRGLTAVKRRNRWLLFIVLLVVVGLICAWVLTQDSGIALTNAVKGRAKPRPVSLTAVYVPSKSIAEGWPSGNVQVYVLWDDGQVRGRGVLP